MLGTDSTGFVEDLVRLEAGAHTITAADLLPDDLQDALAEISSARPGAH